MKAWLEKLEVAPISDVSVIPMLKNVTGESAAPLQGDPVDNKVFVSF